MPPAALAHACLKAQPACMALKMGVFNKSRTSYAAVLILAQFHDSSSPQSTECFKNTLVSMTCHGLYLYYPFLGIFSGSQHLEKENAKVMLKSC